MKIGDDYASTVSKHIYQTLFQGVGVRRGQHLLGQDTFTQNLCPVLDIFHRMDKILCQFDNRCLRFSNINIYPRFILTIIRLPGGDAVVDT